MEFDAREDGDWVEHWRAIVRAILDQFGPQDAASRLSYPYVALDVEALAREVEDEAVVRSPERLGRSIALCIDHGERIDAGALQRCLAASLEQRTALLEANSRRALGQQGSDRAQLEQSLAIFERCGAVPYAARARIDLGRLTDDEEMVRTGIRALETLGDVDQVERYRSLAG